MIFMDRFCAVWRFFLFFEKVTPFPISLTNDSLTIVQRLFNDCWPNL